MTIRYIEWPALPNDRTAADSDDGIRFQRDTGSAVAIRNVKVASDEARPPRATAPERFTRRGQWYDKRAKEWRRI